MPNKKFCLILISFFLCEQLNAEVEFPLDGDILPISYELTLLAYVESSVPKFKGCVHIMVRCVKPTNMITLNQRYLSIKTKRVRVWAVTEKGEERIPVSSHYHGHAIDNNFDRYIIKLNQFLKENMEYKMVIDFSKYSSYRNSAYIDVPYRVKNLHPDVEYIAYTRMNEIEARTIFPNFDNLDKKATFKLNIAHDSTVKAITNAEFVKSQPMKYPSGWVMEEFAEMKNPMSTFSLALVLVDFESNTKVITQLGSNDRVMSAVMLRVSAEKKVLTDMKETLKIISKILLHFAKFFDVPYELKKLDLVVLPDPRIDVLGYYGLIYLGEDDILKAFKEPSYKFSLVKYSMVSKLCNVISSQWIGHSATMSSWNDSWLHIGLNKYLEKFCVDIVTNKIERSSGDLYLSWKIHTDQQIMNSFLDLLRTEERGDFNPVKPVGSDFTFHKDSANSETISKVHYTLRMLTFIMKSGEEYESKFQKSLKTYIELFKFKNSDIQKVWDIFNTIANEEQIIPEGITIQQIMESWLGKKGHPLVIVSRPEPNKIIVTQEPFNSSNKGEGDQEQCWIVPLRFRIKNDTDKFEKQRVREWLKCDGVPLEIYVKDNDWILFNLNLHVPARVRYDFDNWNLIEDLLMDEKQFSKIEYSARIHLISDMFALIEAEKISYESVFNKMKYLTHEPSHVCWQLAYEEIMKIRSRWLGTRLFEPFQKYVLGIARSVFDKKFKSIEEFFRSDRRLNLFENIIVKTMCTFEDAECQEYGEKIFKNWYTNTKDDVTNLPPELVESIFCLAVKNAGVKEWEFLYTYQKDKKDNRILSALGCSSNTTLLRRLKVYGTLVTRGDIKPEFCFNVFKSLLKNKLGYEIVEDHLHFGMNNLSSFLLDQGRDITVEDILAKVYEAAKTDKYMKRLDSAYSTVETKVGDKAKLLEESKLKAEKNMSWLQRYEETLLKYFKNLNDNNSVKNYKFASIDKI